MVESDGPGGGEGGHIPRAGLQQGNGARAQRRASGHDVIDEKDVSFGHGL